MEKLTLPHAPASPTTASIGRDSCPFSPPAVHSECPQHSIKLCARTDSAPYFLSVTAVGGTFGIPEVAVNFSGGGFSNYVRCVFAMLFPMNMNGALLPSLLDLSINRKLSNAS
jgi:hypothetical protein